MRRIFELWLLAATLIVLIGCTTAEWKKIGEDAWAAAPDAIEDIMTNPNPVNIAIVVAAFVAGLVGKSAARGFGKASSKTAKLAATVVKSVLKTKDPDPPPQE